MKKLNNTDLKVLEKIMTKPNISRTDLSIELELTPAAISKIVKKLMELKIIVEKFILSSTGGRPRTSLAINKDYRNIIGINLGVGFINTVMSNLDGEILSIRERKFSFKTQDKVISLLKEEIGGIIEGYDIKNIIGIGLATHGIVDKKNGIAIMSPHFKWKNLEVRKKLEEYFNIPVVVENDVRAMLMAENHYGCANDIKDFLLLYIRNGVGAAIYLNGKIFEGSNYASGEIGHFIVNEKSNIQCRCGKYGCLETEYSEQAILNKIIIKLEEKGIDCEKLTICDVYKYARVKISPYYEIVKEVSFETGKVVGNVLNILDLKYVIVVGDITSTKEIFFDNFKKGIKKMLLDDFSRNISVIASKLDDAIGIFGAISLIRENLFTGKKFLKI